MTYAQAEVIPAGAKPVGEVVFYKRIRACWASKPYGTFGRDCEEWGPANETWIVWKPTSDVILPGTTPRYLCITTQYLTADPGECAWASTFNLYPQLFRSPEFKEYNPQKYDINGNKIP
jgi:hypothetical protein